MDIRYKMYPYPVLAYFLDDYKDKHAFDVKSRMLRTVLIRDLYLRRPLQIRNFSVLCGVAKHPLYIIWSVRRLVFAK